MDTLYLRTALGTLVGYGWFFAIVFLPAWTLAYWQGWAFVLTLSISTTLATIYMARHDRQLLESRLRMGPTAETTPAQKLITSLGAVVFVAAAVISVLDHRFRWSPAVPGWLSIAGDALGAIGIFLYYLVIKENRYAAATVGVVAGQTVVSTGPYALVRHPMYTGALLVLIGAPLALGSWWGLVFVPAFIAGFVWRLLDEEKYLGAHLPGYTDYMHRVRHRLVPGIW